MTKTLLASAAAMVCGGVFLLAGQETVPAAVYTGAQAAAGKTAYRSSCGKCHTESLRGRMGQPDELPPVSSLPQKMQDVVQTAGGMVPPLAGPDFLAVWGVRTTSDLSRRVKEAVGGFPPEGADRDTYLNLTAYFLQACGAPSGAQPLTASTAVKIRSLMADASQKQ